MPNCASGNFLADKPANLLFTRLALGVLPCSPPLLSVRPGSRGHDVSASRPVRARKFCLPLFRCCETSDNEHPLMPNLRAAVAAGSSKPTVLVAEKLGEAGRT